MGIYYLGDIFLLDSGKLSEPVSGTLFGAFEKSDNKGNGCGLA